MNFKYAIALTGGIATGKSSVAKIFREYGLEIIDADKIAHQTLDKNSKEIAKLFGEKYIIENRVNRKELGKLIFSNRDKKRELEEFIHPLIYQEILNQSDKLDRLKRKYIIDIPLFFETKRYPIRDVIVVYTPKELQLKRLIKRDNISKDEALKRINSQIDKKKNGYILN